MVVQPTLERYGVVSLDRDRGGTVPGSKKLRRGPPSSTDCGSGSSGVTMEELNRANGHKTFTIAHWNAEGVRRKKLELQNFLRKSLVDVCCIQETHLSKNYRFSIRGYQMFRQDREHRTKGGILTLVRNSIPAHETQRSEDTQLETEFLGVRLAQQNLVIYNLYSPPDKPIELHNLILSEENWIVVGDFNSHSPSWGYKDLDNKGEEVENWIISNQLILLNKPDDPPTFYSRTWRSTTRPDLAIATEDIHKISERLVCPQLGGSDHRPVTITLQERRSNTKTAPPSWNFKKANWQLFQQTMEQSVQALNLEKDINRSVAIFNEAVLRAAKIAIPRGSRKNYKPYWTTELDTLHRNLENAREAAEQNPSDDNVMSLSRAKSLFNREKNNATRACWHEKTNSLNLERGSGALWKLTQSLNDDNRNTGCTVLKVDEEIHTGKKAANTFARMYKDVSNSRMNRSRVKEIRKETRLLRPTTAKPTSRSMTEIFSINELRIATRKLKLKKSPGPDRIHNEMLKHLGKKAQNHLLDIFNQSWSQGKVPDCWKEAEIIPILKKGKPKEDPKSYRPISLVSCTGKLMERMINLRLKHYLETHNLLSNSQTGYREHRSTEDQLALLTQSIENAYQEKKKVLAVFFDLSSAFDKVWKEGLLYKLAKAGINSRMYSWIRSFLFKRTARVKTDHCLSKKVLLREGVPQGGVLSPTLFLVYMNDIIDVITRHVSNSLHADDLALWTVSEYTPCATVRMQQTVTNIDKWTRDWGLLVNSTKTCVTLFSLSPKKEHVQLSLHDVILPITENPRFLGVTLDTRLTWKPQLDTMEERSIKKLSLMKKLAGTTWGANLKVLKQLYEGTVRPVMEYASTSWGTSAPSKYSSLDKVQNMGLRIMCGALKSTPIKEMEKNNRNTTPWKQEKTKTHSTLRKDEKTERPQTT